jgi:predicted aldo/keto reductase-like oxidoreductase
MKGYELAEKLGVPVVIMEPIKGGSLANLPGSITENFTKLKKDNSTASWALRWVASLPNVKVVLSGMSTMDQVKDNLDTFGQFMPLSDEEQVAVARVTKELRERINNGCTGCNYCMPCPVGVNIPYNFKIWNSFGIYENKGEAIWLWSKDIDEKEKAKKCVSCGKCEKVCPQKIEIRKDLAKLQLELDSLHY